MTQDRIKNPVLMLIRSMLSRIDTMAMYHAKVVGQSGNTVDVQPDDARLPAMSKVPLRHGLPGVSISLMPGTSIMVGWSGGDPAQPYCALWEGAESGATLTINAASLNLGGTGGDLPVTLTKFIALFNAHTHTALGPTSPTTVPVVPALPATATAATITMVK